MGLCVDLSLGMVPPCMGPSHEVMQLSCKRRFDD
ncbi:unnamed protein product [Musa acuminata subsp. malaccensis]|uniref:(wild Malaysian banana) hypothetical protein n=1 Tax=Musa acuminata subsp. malaccensis TaxID=214687 RepID=A0A804L281_MUSAM|nr:unnamed protein product [Musa acuminata subsp. malaccensis]